MHRIDGPAAAPGNLFTEGDPNVGTPATVVTDDWLNAVQEEVCTVVETAGIALSKPSNAQLLAAITKLIGNAVPVGQVIQGYYPTAPAGFLLCNGALVSRTAYPALWAHASGTGLAVAEATWSASAWTMFGVGDGSTTFRLPDLRGEFVRGADLARGVDGGRGLGSWQGDTLKAHSHTVPTSGTDISGAGFIADASAPNISSANTDATGGAETRPRNAALAFCVRH